MLIKTTKENKDFSAIKKLEQNSNTLDRTKQKEEKFIITVNIGEHT